MTKTDAILKQPRSVLDILDCGRGWLAVDKPAGLSVHNDPGQDVCSLAAVQLQNDAGLSARIDPQKNFGVHAAHRLDRDTSGVVLLAARPEVARFLTGQFENGAVSKHYHALLHGILKPPDDPTEWGQWGWPLAKKAGGRLNPAGDGRRQSCLTKFKIMSHSRHYTQVMCIPQTGRKHQIRRHAKLAGHPIVGDRRYGSRRSLAYLESKHGFNRLGLHAVALTFAAPEMDQPVTVRSREIPKEMLELFETDMPIQK